MKATIVSIDSAMISTMVDYKERIEKAMKAAGVDITELARSVGVSYQAARKVLEGESKAFTAENNAKAAARLNVSSDWLATGMGDMARNANSIVFSEENEDLVRIPLLANSGSMGKGNDTLDADYVVGDLALSAHWINQHIKPGNLQELKFIHAHGESMSPTFSDGDVLLVNVHALHRISRYKDKDSDTPPRVYKLGSGAWQRMKNATKSAVKDIARELIKLYAERKESGGFAFSPDGYLQHELEASFPYEETPDQQQAVARARR